LRFPLDPVEGFVDDDVNIATSREPLDDVGDQGSGGRVIDYPVRWL